MIRIWYTNADVLTKEKLRELTEDIDTTTPPDIIAINEIKPKNYGRELNKIDYKISGYEFESVNLDDNGPTRGVVLYIRNQLKFSKLNIYKLLNTNSNLKEMIPIEVSFSDNTKLLLSNSYRSPNSSAEENEFFRNSVKLKRFHQIVIGDFNRKNIDWITATSTSDDDCRFVEATRDSFLTQHILTPTRGRGPDEPSILDLLFTSRNESVESVDFHAPLGKSDHSVIKVMYRSVANYEKMRRMLDINWHELFNDCQDDIDLMRGIFMSNYYAADKACIPKKIINTGKRKFSYPLDRYSLSRRKKKH